MSCKNQWEQEIAGRLEAAARVAAGQVDGGQRCDHAGCDALVNLATNACVQGHVQGVRAATGRIKELEAVLCLYTEVREQGGFFTDRYDEDPRVQAGAKYLRAARPTVRQGEEVLRGYLEIFDELSGDLGADPRVQAARWRVDPARAVWDEWERTLPDSSDSVEFTYEEGAARLYIGNEDWERLPDPIRRAALEAAGGTMQPEYTVMGGESWCLDLQGRAGLQRVWAALEQYRPGEFTPPAKGEPGATLYEYLQGEGVVQGNTMHWPQTADEAYSFGMTVWQSMADDEFRGLYTPGEQGMTVGWVPMVQTFPGGALSIVVVADPGSADAPGPRVVAGRLEWTAGDAARTRSFGDFLARYEQARQEMAAGFRAYPALHRAWQQAQYEAQVVTKPLSMVELRERARQVPAGEDVEVVVAVPMAEYMAAAAEIDMMDESVDFDFVLSQTVDGDVPVALGNLTSYKPVGLRPAAGDQPAQILVLVRINMDDLDDDAE